MGRRAPSRRARPRVRRSVVDAKKKAPVAVVSGDESRSLKKNVRAILPVPSRVARTRPPGTKRGRVSSLEKRGYSPRASTRARARFASSRDPARSVKLERRLSFPFERLDRTGGSDVLPRRASRAGPSRARGPRRPSPRKAIRRRGSRRRGTARRFPCSARSARRDRRIARASATRGRRRSRPPGRRRNRRRAPSPTASRRERALPLRETKRRSAGSPQRPPVTAPPSSPRRARSPTTPPRDTRGTAPGGV